MGIVDLSLDPEGIVKAFFTVKDRIWPRVLVHATWVIAREPDAEFGWDAQAELSNFTRWPVKVTAAGTFHFGRGFERELAYKEARRVDGLPLTLPAHGGTGELLIIPKNPAQHGWREPVGVWIRHSASVRPRVGLFEHHRPTADQ